MNQVNCVNTSFDIQLINQENMKFVTEEVADETVDIATIITETQKV